jgi:hypothetical protein
MKRYNNQRESIDYLRVCIKYIVLYSGVTRQEKGNLEETYEINNNDAFIELYNSGVISYDATICNSLDPVSLRTRIHKEAKF